MLEFLPVSKDDRETICKPPTSLQLKNTLTETLCKMQDLENLKKLFDASDANFQLKMFLKLPPVC